MTARWICVNVLQLYLDRSPLVSHREVCSRTSARGSSVRLLVHVDACEFTGEAGIFQPVCCPKRLDVWPRSQTRHHHRTRTYNRPYLDLKSTVRKAPRSLSSTGRDRSQCFVSTLEGWQRPLKAPPGPWATFEWEINADVVALVSFPFFFKKTFQGFQKCQKQNDDCPLKGAKQRFIAPGRDKDVGSPGSSSLLTLSVNASLHVQAV